MNNPFLELAGVAFDYESAPLLHNLDFQLFQGETVSIVGASGAGKTTLFRLLTCLNHPKKGKILLNGAPLQDPSYVTYMMQEDLLLPWRNVEDNVSLLNELKGVLSKQSRLEILEEVGLLPYRKFYPRHLSGGMRQRAALARALMQNRPLLLLDEPFASLDFKTKEQLFELIEKVKKNHGLTILMITHDFNDALELSNRIALLSGGKISNEWQIPKKELLTPYLSGQLQTEIKEEMRK